ncbi:lipid A deacylase LpxR family protein [Mucilaginibacter ginkgonis]|uniref:Lipid A deacylase LpxR family protein n=1 Tax=Mucilaginibacter ginkgonis TaxID=2682091 RepID=A0A6I4I235_9SPHI|nr:lipid A deacylase LpxR family protein [Mucilaginibacter ginkgonis]QQL48461.1 lipid A deacylase LpxR family protein [Mucilaginibacter ginkgonis]
MTKFLTALLLLLTSYTLTQAQTHSHEMGFQSDNDGYLAQGSDRYYTNGIFVNYRHALTVNAKSKLANKVLGLEIGQKMYNPQSGSVPSALYIDRPFAGYLYAGATLNFLYKNESNLKLGLQAGVIGPASYTKQIQEFIHRTFGFYPPTGWEYQIRNNAVVNLSAEYNKLLYRSGAFDVSLSAYGNAGTGFDGAGVGPMLRLGTFNKLFNSAATQSSSIKNGSAYASTAKHELFFYYKPQYNYVGYDATVQGNIFGNSDDTGNTPQITGALNHLMFSNQLGGDYTYDRLTIDFSVIFHTKDVKTMVDAHQWGSIALLYHFN